MTIDRAIEILNPEHRERYDSIETVNEACRMGIRALKLLKELPSLLEELSAIEEPSAPDHQSGGKDGP